MINAARVREGAHRELEVQGREIVAQRGRLRNAESVIAKVTTALPAGAAGTFIWVWGKCSCTGTGCEVSYFVEMFT